MKSGCWGLTSGQEDDSEEVESDDCMAADDDAGYSGDAHQQDEGVEGVLDVYDVIGRVEVCGVRVHGHVPRGLRVDHRDQQQRREAKYQQVDAH